MAPTVKRIPFSRYSRVFEFLKDDALLKTKLGKEMVGICVGDQTKDVPAIVAYVTERIVKEDDVDPGTMSKAAVLDRAFDFLINQPLPDPLLPEHAKLKQMTEQAPLPVQTEAPMKKRRGRPPKIKVEVESQVQPQSQVQVQAEPVKKRRGRPPKVRVEALPAVQPQVEVPVAVAAEAPVKKRRGRPPKIKVEAPPVAPAPATVQVEAPVKKRRGRPPKVKPVGEIPTPERRAEAPKEEATAASPAAVEQVDTGKYVQDVKEEYAIKYRPEIAKKLLPCIDSLIGISILNLGYGILQLLEPVLDEAHPKMLFDEMTVFLNKVHGLTILPDAKKESSAN